MLRFSADRWSTNSTPSRWSISCCRQAASSPSASISCARALEVPIAHLDPRRPGHVGILAGQRQAALLARRPLLADADDLGVDQVRSAPACRPASGRPRPAAARRPTCGAARPMPGRRIHGRQHRGTSARTASVVGRADRARLGAQDRVRAGSGWAGDRRRFGVSDVAARQPAFNAAASPRRPGLASRAVPANIGGRRDADAGPATLRSEEGADDHARVHLADVPGLRSSRADARARVQDVVRRLSALQHRADRAERAAHHPRGGRVHDERPADHAGGQPARDPRPAGRGGAGPRLPAPRHRRAAVPARVRAGRRDRGQGRVARQRPAAHRPGAAAAGGAGQDDPDQQARRRAGRPRSVDGDHPSRGRQARPS